MPKRTASKAAELPLPITAEQVRSVLMIARVSYQLRRKLEAATPRQPALFSDKQLQKLVDHIDDSVPLAPPPFKQNLLDLQLLILEMLDDADHMPPLPPGRPGELLQFKIQLLDIKPPIWRRIQMPDGSLGDLHDVIQAAFGWEESHLHQFIIAGEQYGPALDDDPVFGPPDWLDEDSVRLSQLLPTSPRVRWRYEYDFGDGWLHEIAFEGWQPPAAKTKYPLCLDGARASPPEDSGGPWNYPNLLAALSDPDHPEHEDLLDWCGPFDPEKFDPKQATREMRRTR